ncbi:MAG: efflux RND transporter periplasmic adaptor subunit [Vicinamibacterales bacterium]
MRARLVVPLVLVISTGCATARDPAASTDSDVRQVRVETVDIRDLRRAVDVVGTLAARDEVVVSAETAGRVITLERDLGDRVDPGDVLVALDPEKARYGVEAQRAGLAQARAKYGAPDAGDLPPLDHVPAVVSAAAQLADARQRLERAKSLAAGHLISDSDLETAQTRYDTAVASHQEALASARELRADIEAKTSALRLAERGLRDTEIRAPFRGFVAERLVSVGQYVQAQTPIMRLVQLHPLKVTAEIPEKFAPWIERGREVSVRVDAFPSETFTGRIVRVSPSVNLRSRAFAVEGEVPNPDGRLKPGTFARLAITTDHVDRAITIPLTAVQSRYGTNRVFFVRDGVLEGHEVVLGDRLGDRVEVTEGLDAGAAVVAADVEPLTDGMKVALAR